MVVGSRAGSLEVMSPASLLPSSAKSRAGISASPIVASPTEPESPEAHKSKVSSVLLPIYPASVAQKEDVYKGYDKVTHSPTHAWGLPKWQVSEETKAKYRPPQF